MSQNINHKKPVEINFLGAFPSDREERERRHLRQSKHTEQKNVDLIKTES